MGKRISGALGPKWKDFDGFLWGEMFVLGGLGRDWFVGCVIDWCFMPERDGVRKGKRLGVWCLLVINDAV